MALHQRKPDSSSIPSAIASTASSVEQEVASVLHVLWDDLPSWMQDNHFIHGGYRPASNSYAGSFASLGYLHNESVNIYSHLLGAVAFAAVAAAAASGTVGTGIRGALAAAAVPRHWALATPADVAVFGCFFAGAAACLGMSAAYHAISNHSPAVARMGNKLDYAGIVSLITGSFVPAVYYGFYCEPRLQKIYWAMIGTLGVGCTAASIFDRFRTPDWRPYRAAMFVGMGLSAVFPILHGLIKFGLTETSLRLGLTWIVLEGLLYILGAALYALRWPERTAPGAYDIWGSSHQIFHVLVLMAAFSHLYGMIRAFDYHHGTEGSKC